LGKLRVHKIEDFMNAVLSRGPVEDMNAMTNDQAFCEQLVNGN
jgi:hypothetical protein